MEISGQYLKLLLDSTSAAFYAVDNEGHTTHCNEAFLKMLGFQNAEEVIGRKLHGLIHHSHADGSHYPVEECPIYNAAQKGIARHISNENFYHVDGSPIPVEYWAQPLMEDGKLLGAVCTFVDISERRKAENALRESEQRFRFLSRLDEATREIQDADKVMVITTHMLGEYLDVSRCAYADVEEDNNHFTIRYDYCAPGITSTAGKYSLDLFGSRAVQKIRTGQTLVFRDVDQEAASDDGADMFHAIGINAIICCPLVKSGKLKAMMAVHQHDSYDWTSDQIRLIESVVERCWAHIERIAVQEDLKLSEERSRLIINTALDAVIMTDASGIVTEWNHQAEITFGWTYDEALGRQMADMIIPHESRSAHNIGMARFLKTGEQTILNKRIEVLALNKGGDTFPIELTVTAQDVHGSPYFTAFARDIRNQKKSALALYEAQERSRLILASIKDYAVISLNIDAIITDWNSGAEEIFGHSAAEAIGQHAALLFTPEDRTIGAHIKEMAIATETGRAIDERWHIRKDQSRFFASEILSAIHDNTGRLLGFTKVARDITIQKNAEEAMIEARNAAEAANLAKSEFLANMSHEIRTPMNAIIGLSNILAMSQPLTPKQKEFVSTLQLSADSLLMLINDLLDISKIEARSVELEQIPFDMTRLVQEVISMTSLSSKEKGLAFTMDAECVRNKNYIGDPTRLRQIMSNLCSNAVKFTEKGGIHISISCNKTIHPLIEEIFISVRDTGIGIPPEKLETIFQKFMQADTSINRKYGGTGLGLAITKTLAEIMGGTIEVESTVGEGSTFKICLKLPMAASGEESAYVEGAHITPQDEHTEISGQKVLVVEDYAANVMVACTFLEQFGYITDVANNGQEALDKVKTSHYAAVLMDVQMHGMNGLDATRLIREYEAKSNAGHVPIIGMTAHALTGDRERCISVGMDDYISKPFNPDELKEKLASLIQAA